MSAEESKVGKRTKKTNLILDLKASPFYGDLTAWCVLILFSELPVMTSVDSNQI